MLVRVINVRVCVYHLHGRCTVLRSYRSYSCLKLIVNLGAHCEIAHYYLSLINLAALAKFEGFITLLRVDSNPVSCYVVMIGKYLLTF